jgi:hypothetical protein
VLNEDVSNFNELFLEREETNVIRLRSLEDEAEAATTADALRSVHRLVADRHSVFEQHKSTCVRARV